MSNYECQGQRRRGMDAEKCLSDIKFDTAMCSENVLGSIERLENHPNKVDSQILLQHFSITLQYHYN